MNRIIFMATALIGLALVASNGFHRPKSGCGVGETLLMSQTSGREVPAKKSASTKVPLVAIEVTDEALEKLRRLAKLSNTAWPTKSYRLQ